MNISQLLMRGIGPFVRSAAMTTLRRWMMIKLKGNQTRKIGFAPDAYEHIHIFAQAHPNRKEDYVEIKDNNLFICVSLKSGRIRKQLVHHHEWTWMN